MIPTREIDRFVSVWVDVVLEKFETKPVTAARVMELASEIRQARVAEATGHGGRRPSDSVEKTASRGHEGYAIAVDASTLELVLLFNAGDKAAAFDSLQRWDRELGSTYVADTIEAFRNVMEWD